MALGNGCNHVTVITENLDRFIAFYRDVFEAEVVLDLSEGDMRHALIDVGGGFCLHPFQFPKSSDNARGTDAIFNRGHIDHFAINFDTEANFEKARRRLHAAGATTGRVRDFGMVRIMTFEDPDGMNCEIAIWGNEAPRTMEASTVEYLEPA